MCIALEAGYICLYFLYIFRDEEIVVCSQMWNLKLGSKYWKLQGVPVDVGFH